MRFSIASLPERFKRNNLSLEMNLLMYGKEKKVFSSPAPARLFNELCFFALRLSATIWFDYLKRGTHKQ